MSGPGPVAIQAATRAVQTGLIQTGLAQTAGSQAADSQVKESQVNDSPSAVADHRTMKWPRPAQGEARPARSLVIGIGNPLRSDDGVGWQLAEEVGGLAVHQLTPELAAELAAVDRVLFVDAWQLALGPGRSQPWLRPVAPGAGGLGSSHRLEPAELLALAAALYGARPVAHELLLPAREFAHGTRLSPPLRRQLPRARRLLRQWLHGQWLLGQWLHGQWPVQAGA